jgi:VanZ family protein
VTSPANPKKAHLGEPGTSSGNFFRDVLPALVWTVILFVLGGLPTMGPSVDIGFPIDKIEHAIAFGILQFLTLRALRYELPLTWPRGMPWVAALCSTVAGGALELYQLTVPNRSAEFMDLVADAIGAALFAALTRATKK